MSKNSTYSRILCMILPALMFTISCDKPTQLIHVSTTGNDSSAGTEKAPFKTLERARDEAVKYTDRPTEIIIENGTYYLEKPLVFNSEHSGSEDSPITYRAANSGSVVISGGLPLDLDWKPYKNGIYTTQIPDNVSTIDQLYVDGINQRMARFPNAIFGKNVFDTWDLVHTKKPDPEKDPLQKVRIQSYKNPEGAYVHAMHMALWGDMHWLVKGKTKSDSLILEGGWQNNRPSPMHPRYRIIENVFEELDEPGEWYYDKQAKLLYYYPKPETNLQDATIEVVRLKQLVEFRGTKENPVKFINLDGIVFKHAARSFMENKEQLLRSDWTTFRGGAIYFTGAVNCSISNSEFDQLGGNSIFVDSYNRKLNFTSCYIHDSGASGIAFVGDPASVRSPLFRYGPQNFDTIDRTPGPQSDNYPANCVVDDCLITMTGRFEKQTSPIQISMSSKITVSHCSIYDVPRAGINISEGTFGGHIIEYCDVFNTVLETGDHGSFNSWGRDRFWTPDINETAKQVEKDTLLPYLDVQEPNIIRNSRWRCDHGWDIDLDDGSSHYLIYNNLLLNRGLKLREGYHRKAYNNIILNNSLHPHVWYPNSGDVFKNNIVSGAYRPAIMNRGIPEDGKWGAQIDSNLFITKELDRAKFLKNQADINSTVGDPKFIDHKSGDYRVSEDSPALAMGFKNFDMDAFGVVSEKLKALTKTPELPNILFTDGGLVYVTHEWHGAKIKDVQTWEEISAAGLSDIQGIILLDVPLDSKLGKSGFKTGDVIVGHKGSPVADFSDLQSIMRRNRTSKSMLFDVVRNQETVGITLQK